MICYFQIDIIGNKTDMASGDELPDIPDIPSEESTSKRRMSDTSDKTDRARPTQATKRPNVRSSTSKPGRYDKAKEWLDESPIRDRSISRSGKQRIPHTADEKDARREADRQRHATAEYKEANRLSHAAARNQETADEANARREADRLRHSAVRRRKKTTLNLKDAARNKEILDGVIEVQELHKTEDNIGTMTDV